MSDLETIKVGKTAVQKATDKKVKRAVIDRTKLSKAHAKTLAQIEVLTAKRKNEGLTAYESKLLLNATKKIEQKSLGAWYKFAKTQDKVDIKVLMRGKELPPFKEIMGKAPSYKSYSYWDLLTILSKISKQEVK